uniref:Polyketide synthase n=1 Tax=Peronospora matthiolae TaxID=2874970 RepID=A0AAV1UST7_9STRA
MFQRVTNAFQDASSNAWVTESVTVTGFPRVALRRRHKLRISSTLHVL